jgi:hypothetical protein
MKIIVKFQTLVSFLGAFLLAYFKGNSEAISFFIGSAVILGSACLMAFAWGNIIKKKFIALSGALIVSKYAILAVIIYYLVDYPGISLLWFCLGVASFGLSAFAYAIAESKK